MQDFCGKIHKASHLPICYKKWLHKSFNYDLLMIFFQPQRRKSRAMSIMPTQNKEEKIDEEHFDEEGGGGKISITIFRLEKFSQFL